jgi:hypothetical protein
MHTDGSTEKTNHKDAKSAEFLKLPEKNLCVLCVSAVKIPFFSVEPQILGLWDFVGFGVKRDA